MQQTKPCPICNVDMRTIDARFPDTVCDACNARAVDGEGNKIEFFNDSFGGGLVAKHTKIDGTDYEDENFDCTIDAKQCRGVEFHMGGTGIELVS